MNSVFARKVSIDWGRAAVVVLAFGSATALGADWPQYRGPTTQGTSPDLIATSWATNSSSFVVWTNPSLTNGFSSFAVSQGRAFALISRDDGSGTLMEYCVAVDATTGSEIWATPIGVAPWDPSVTYNGGAGTAPYNTGDGPHTTPSVKDGRVFALSGYSNIVYCTASYGKGAAAARSRLMACSCRSVAWARLWRGRGAGVERRGSRA